MDKGYKRTSHEMSPEQKMKISNALKGKPKSIAWRNKISAGQKKAWASIKDKEEPTDFTSSGRIV